MKDKLSTDISYLKQVGPKRAELLNKELGIYTFEDLLYYFPYKYIDRTKFYKINQINTTQAYIQIQGQITGFHLEGKGRNQRLMARFADETGTIELVWFKGISWVQRTYQTNTNYIIFGKPYLFKGRLSIAHPEIDTPDTLNNQAYAGFQPQYSLTEKLRNNYFSSKTIWKLMENLLANVKSDIEEILPGYVLHKTRLISLKEALKYIHFPTGTDALKKAIHRLKFDELFFIQLNILMQRNARRKYFKGHIFSRVGDYVNNFYSHHLKFELTEAQKRVIKEIRKDLGSGKQMNRLLQGDVGSGKTLAALMAMLISLDNGFQSCIMAPTEILANQHFNTLSSMLEKLDIRIRLLTGSTRKKDREEIYTRLTAGELDIIVGTHALLEETVIFKNLGLVVIDEQHRFGVAQRAKLWKKNTQPPHVLVMTATPIPRTLAMTLYGDLDVSVIDEMPPGRKSITTIHYFDNKRLAMFGFLRKQIAEGKQIYIVYPLIKESEKLDLKDLEDGYEAISRAFPPPDYVVTCVHGQMKPADKDAAMDLFVKGQAHILVATTVIEVGVDVSNASVMVIESAERFGLSQLHQLRGRVGRGADQSYCILMSSPKLSEEARKRIKTMCSTNDGFEIAEIDLRLRGPGDLEGTQQSGIPFDLRIANLGKDGQLLQYARNLVTDILDDDPELSSAENAILKKQLIAQKTNHTDWSVIS